MKNRIRWKGNGGYAEGFTEGDRMARKNLEMLMKSREIWSWKEETLKG
jgi:hypothetical protein